MDVAYIPLCKGEEEFITSTPVLQLEAGKPTLCVSKVISISNLNNTNQQSYLQHKDMFHRSVHPKSGIWYESHSTLKHPATETS